MNTTEQSALQTIRERFLFLQTGQGAPSAAQSSIAHAVEGFERLADKVIARQIWDPANPEHGNTHGEPISHALFTYGTNYFGDPQRLARVWGCSFSKYYQSPEILERIIASLRFGERHVRPDQPRDGSWYYWDIMFAGHLLTIMVICGDKLPADLRALLTEDIAQMPCKIFSMDREHGITRPPITSGSNNLEVLTTGLLRGLAFNDSQWIKAVMAQAPVAMGRTGGEGLQTDWSYHFHGHGINVGYGHHGLEKQAEWFFLTQGTPWQLPDAVRELQVGMFREFFARNIWRGRVAPYSTDRGMASGGAIYAREFFTAALLGLATDFTPEEKAVFAAAVADYFQGLDHDGKPFPSTEYGLVPCLLLNRIPQPIQADARLLAGTRFYPESEYLLARKDSWFAAARMSSTRTSTWKSMLGGHVHSSSVAEFSIALMTDGREFDTTVIPTMNWKRLMGVTRCDAIEPPPEGYGQSTFSSGLAGDDMAVMGWQYVLAPAGQATLRANKSLFVTPQALIMLGSLIRCDADEPVFTTLFYAPILNDGPYLRNNSPLDVQQDGVWELKAGEMVFLRNVGIHLMSDARLIVETRKGTYAGMSDPQRSGPVEQHLRANWNTEYERRFVYLIVNHGVQPKTAGYGVIICPGTTPKAMPVVNAFNIKHEDTHHVVTVENGATGAEVRFPGDWRKPIGSSYWGAEQHQWGSIARWKPGDDADHAQMEIIAPRRFGRAEGASTEIFLPEGLAMENVTLKTYAGQPFPANLISTNANGKAQQYRVRKTRV